MWFDLGVSALGDLSRDELISLARAQAERIAEQEKQIAELTAANEAVAARLARFGASAVAELVELVVSTVEGR